MEKLLKRSTDRGPMRGRESSLDAKLTTVGLLRIRIKEATNVKTTGKHRSLYCQFTCGTQKAYSRLMSPKPAPGGGANQNEELQSTLYFDETLNILIEQRAMELQIVVFQPHSLDVDKLIGHDVVRLSDCKELETTEFCVKLSKPKNAQLTFEASYFGLLTEEETKEYGEYLYVLSEETFVDLFKKDRLGFSLSETELKDYSTYTRSKKENPLVRSFSKKKWQHWKTSKELKQMGRKGLPLSHRAEVWLTSSRAKERKAENKGMYWTILEVHKDEHSPHQAQILKDLDRTFPGHRVYLDKRGLLPLQRVLMAYAWKNSSIGYCQSMNFITAFLLLFMDEESAFWLLSAIVEELVPDYYAPIMIGAKADQIVFCQLVEKKLPAIHAHLTKLNVPYQQASMQWFLSLFIDQLPTETTLRVLDAFFCEGSMVLMRVGLAILKMKEKQILATPDFESCWMLLKRVTKTIFDSDTLMKLAFGELGSFKELKIATRRGHAYRQIEEKGSITTYQGLKKVFRLENGRSLRNLRDSLADHSETPFSFRVELATLTEHLLKINSNLDHADIKAVFKILDQDLKGTIDFYDLICALSLVFNGVPVEKMMVCFQMLDTDLDGKLDVREMQHLLSMHYKWLRRTLKTGRDWQVDAVVQHDIDLLSKKTRPYLEEKGGKVDYVEFRFKIAPELEALEAWLRSEPREVGPVRRTAAQILEEEKEKEKEKENSRENGKGKEKEKEREKGTRVNILLSSVDLDTRPASSCDESGRGDGLKGRRSNSSDSLHELMLKVQGNRISRGDEKKSPRKPKTKKEKSPSKKRWSTKKNRKYKTYKEEVIREFKDKSKDWDPAAQDPWKKGDGKDGLVADDVKQSDD